MNFSRSPDTSPLRIPDLVRRAKRKTKKSLDVRSQHTHGGAGRGHSTGQPTSFGLHGQTGKKDHKELIFMKHHPLNPQTSMDPPLLITTDGQIMSGRKQTSSRGDASSRLKKKQTSMPTLDQINSPTESQGLAQLKLNALRPRGSEVLKKHVKHHRGQHAMSHSTTINPGKRSQERKKRRDFEALMNGGKIVEKNEYVAKGGRVFF